MSTEIDAATTRELTASVHTLNNTVVRLETLMGQFGPVLQSQVSGLTDCVNRVTRLEDWRDALQTLLKEEKEQRDKQIASNRWLIIATFSAVSLMIAMLSFVAQHIKFQ